METAPSIRTLTPLGYGYTLRQKQTTGLWLHPQAETQHWAMATPSGRNTTLGYGYTLRQKNNTGLWLHPQAETHHWAMATPSGRNTRLDSPAEQIYKSAWTTFYLSLLVADLRLAKQHTVMQASSNLMVMWHPDDPAVQHLCVTVLINRACAFDVLLPLAHWLMQGNRWPQQKQKLDFSSAASSDPNLYDDMVEISFTYVHDAVRYMDIIWPKSIWWYGTNIIYICPWCC